MSMHNTRDALPPINFRALADALLSMADTLVPQWLPGGCRRGPEWVCGSLAGGAGRSTSVNLVDGKWADFSSEDKGGDLLSLYAAIHGLSMAKAAVQVARELHLESVAGLVKAPGGAAVVPAANPRPMPAAKPAPEKEGWSTVVPVPPHAPAPTFRHHHRQPEDLMHTATYAVGADVYGYVVRFRTSDGGKDTLPYTYCQSARDGSQKWNWKQWDEPRPLYLPGGTPPEGRTAVLVEGEVKAEVLQAVLDAVAPGVYCVVSWPGGSKAWRKANWAWLAGASVLLWPDCDAQREPLTKAEREQVKDDEAAKAALQATKPLLPEHKQPGMKAMLGIGRLLADTHACTVQLLPIPKPGEKVSGWDCKDAIEADGWTGEDVLAFFGRAQALPAADAAPAEDAAPANTPLGPVGTGERGSSGFTPDGLDDDDDGQEFVYCGGRKVPRWLSYFWDSGRERWNITRKAVIACLEKDPALKGVVAFNELTNTMAARRPWPWKYARAGSIQNADDLLLGKWLSDTYGLPSVSASALEEAIKTVGYTERFHPIRDWLVEQQWDGKPRLDNWLIFVLGESPASLTAPMQEYLRLVGRFWVLGMVYRVMEPGCKFDYCPVLEGQGGLRKSTLVEVLASTEFYSDTKFDVSRGHEAQEQVQGVWLYEIAELAGFSKSDVNEIKSFITSKKDRYRVAYGKVVEDFPRQCVLVGTTNDDKYLKDPTGNRRFWPIPVRHLINTEWVVKYRHQLFAEAFARYQSRERYTPTKDEEDRLFVPMQGSRLVETAVDGELLRLLTRPAVVGDELISVDTQRIALDDLVKALNVDVGKSTRGLEQQIQGWMNRNGWVNRGRQRIGKTLRSSVYFRPEVWPPEVSDSDLMWSDPPAAADGGVPTGGQAGDASDTLPRAQPPLSAAAQFLADRADDMPF